METINELFLDRGLTALKTWLEHNAPYEVFALLDAVDWTISQNLHPGLVDTSEMGGWLMALDRVEASVHQYEPESKTEED